MLEELVVDDGTICTICTADVVSSFSVSDCKTATKLFSSEAIGDLSDGSEYENRESGTLSGLNGTIPHLQNPPLAH